ncbi:YwaF family protein [Halobacillus salinus]|uniref:YwaF family protein n=1 Tax=Halobacillus salinus TaxID=192814 RepID=UPI001590C5E6|nr:TIGR02206 family membrane protein [Halobacillus salinus]
MNNWFETYSSHPFEPFTLSHWTVLILFLAGILFILISAGQMAKKPQMSLYMRIFLFTCLLVSEVSYQIWAVTNGVWSMALYIPFHLCGVASIIGMITLVTYHPKLIKLNYFIGIIPALIALITPDLLYDYHHFRFWKFFLHHMAIIWTSLFLVVTTGVRITWRTTLKAYLWLVVYGVIVGMINTALDANYMYLDRPPGANTPLDYIGDGIWYYLNLGVIALCVFVLMKLLYRPFKKKFSSKP